MNLSSLHPHQNSSDPDTAPTLLAQDHLDKPPEKWDNVLNKGPLSSVSA
jgi:hypothetical protein